MTPAQDKAWRRLVAAALQAARAPNPHERERAAAAIRRALKATWSTRGGQTQDPAETLAREFRALIDQARGWNLATAEGRSEAGPRLNQAARQVRAILQGRADPAGPVMGERPRPYYLERD